MMFISDLLLETQLVIQHGICDGNFSFKNQLIDISKISLQCLLVSLFMHILTSIFFN